MQAGFTSVRRGRDPLLAFVATLGYIGATFVKSVACADGDVATLWARLRKAFDCFGGAPEHVLFDNTKTVIIDRGACGEGQHRWNKELRELAQTCGFTRDCAGPTGPGPRAR